MLTVFDVPPTRTDAMEFEMLLSLPPPMKLLSPERMWFGAASTYPPATSPPPPTITLPCVPAAIVLLYHPPRIFGVPRVVGLRPVVGMNFMTRPCWLPVSLTWISHD